MKITTKQRSVITNNIITFMGRLKPPDDFVDFMLNLNLKQRKQLYDWIDGLTVKEASKIISLLYDGGYRKVREIVEEQLK